MPIHTSRSRLITFLSLLFYCTNAWSKPDFLTVTWENDIFAGQDGGYTNGLSVAWAYGDIKTFDDHNLPPWLHTLTENLYISTMPGKDRAVSFLVAQAMQTASDISQEQLIEDEAPYAGLAIWQASLYAYDQQLADKLSLAIGFVGPVSGADASQRFIHKITGSEQPRGWDHQLNNEMVFQISAERLWRLTEWQNSAFGFDLIGITRGAVGTLQSNLASGFSLRFGHGLDRNFATATIIPGREVNPLAGSRYSSWSIFFNVLGSLVANDIMINGNTFEDSHSVPLQHLQAHFVTGAAFSLGNWAFLLSAVHATKQYKRQPNSPIFGSLSVTYNF